jgi:large subunit ribosomal protein L15
VKLHDLKPAPGSNPPKRRVGRGTAGRGGKTAGTGTKGQGTRDTIKPGFEGGQTPLTRRTPKLKGFKNPFRVEYAVINLDGLEGFEAGAEVSPETLRARGLVHKHGLVKVLGRGEISKALNVRAHAFSRSAAEAIRAAGGTAETLPLPGGGRRPAARGNALTNR